MYTASFPEILFSQDLPATSFESCVGSYGSDFYPDLYILREGPFSQGASWGAVLADASPAPVYPDRVFREILR